MKRILLVIFILLVAGTLVFAQQSGTTRQDMEKYLDGAKKHASDYQTMLDELKSRNNSSGDIHIFNRLKSEIDRLESRINEEDANITAVHDKGNRVHTQVLEGLERMVDQHQEKVDELDTFLSKSK